MNMEQMIQKNVFESIKEVEGAEVFENKIGNSFRGITAGLEK